MTAPTLRVRPTGTMRTFICCASTVVLTGSNPITGLTFHSFRRVDSRGA